MKKVEAIIRASKLEGVKDALAHIGVRDVAVEPHLIVGIEDRCDRLGRDYVSGREYNRIRCAPAILAKE